MLNVLPQSSRWQQVVDSATAGFDGDHIRTVRGEQLRLAGAVASLRQPEPCAIDATVEGKTGTYEVKLRRDPALGLGVVRSVCDLEGRDLSPRHPRATCTCPDAERFPARQVACKHVIAVALTFEDVANRSFFRLNKWLGTETDKEAYAAPVTVTVTGRVTAEGILLHGDVIVAAPEGATGQLLAQVSDLLAATAVAADAA